MKVFISWSGEQSKQLALALKEWLPLVLHYVEPWLSQADINAGERWADEVAKELEACNFGIICVTRENLNSAWILFEAGALAKSLQTNGSRVIPLLLDLDFSEISGPLAQFQAKKVEMQGVLETVQSLNQAAATPASDERIRQLFGPLWPTLDAKVAAIPKGKSSHKALRPQVEVIEELVGAVRTMEARVRDLNDEPRPRRKNNRPHPHILYEFGRMIGGSRGDPVILLLAASMFRDELPWLYELGMEAYRNSGHKSTRVARESLGRFWQGLNLIIEGAFPIEHLGADSRILKDVLRDVSFLMERYDMSSNLRGEARNDEL